MNEGESAVGFSSCRRTTRSCYKTRGNRVDRMRGPSVLIGKSTVALIREGIGAAVGPTVATVCHGH